MTVDIDLQSFFDEVIQDKLIGIIRRTVKDCNLISQIRKFLQSGVMENEVLKRTKKGTTQEGNLSPLLSNIMLNEFGFMPSFRTHFVTHSSNTLFKFTPISFL